MSQETLPTLRALFHETPISKLTDSPKFTRHIVSIKSEETFYDALYLMNRYHILSLCCMEEKRFGEVQDGSDDVESTILGFLSNLDILFYISEALLLFEFEGHSESFTLRECLNRCVRDIMYQKLETEHYHTVKETETMLSLITGKFARGVHRTIIMKDNINPDFNDQGELVGMLTQSDIIKFAVDSEWRDESFDPVLYLEHNWKDKEVISLYDDDTLEKALQLMSTHSLSAVAVLKRINNQENGMNHDSNAQNGNSMRSDKLIGNFSASDLRRITQEFSEDQPNGNTLTLSQYFNMKILDYLTKYSKTSLNPITINLNDRSLTMRKLVNLFASCRIHRMWIVDENQTPRGVLTLTDLCQFVANQK